MQQYGHVEEDRYPLAAWIWGHRLREDQNWMEYLLEFLNVLAGFDYELGQGITVGSATPPVKQTYQKYTRLGLRRFIFYDEREKTRHPLDDYARQQLIEMLQTQIADNNHLSVQDSLKLARSLLQAFTAVAAQRSWYAKSLFPAHHNLLFWEALRKGATKRTRTVSTAVSLDRVDAQVSFSDRIFFARGGEIYYLILSAATEEKPEQRKRIGDNLRRLLHEHHQALGHLALMVDQSWQGVQASHGNGANGHAQQGKLGWIPAPQDPFYGVIAQDVDILLQAPLDSLELLDLLVHLLCFHLTLYIYHHAQNGAPLVLLIDALDGADGGMIRRVSATCYKAYEGQILERGRSYVSECVQTWLQQAPSADVGGHIYDEAKRYFSLNREKWNRFRDIAERLDDKYRQGALDRQSLVSNLGRDLFDLLRDELRDHFLGVHRKLAKAITLVAPRKGSNERFVLGDTLLKALTLANVPPNDPLTYETFLVRLFERYGLIVGPEQAAQAGLFTRYPINADSYNRNRSALLEIMKRAGLAVEYSDATAMVHGQFSGGA